MRRELSRVHEDRDSDFFSALFREPDERHMAVMERTHGRDERERGIALAKFSAGAVKVRQCPGDDGGVGHSYRCLQRGWSDGGSLNKGGEARQRPRAAWRLCGRIHYEDGSKLNFT